MAENRGFYLVLNIIKKAGGRGQMAEDKKYQLKL